MHVYSSHDCLSIIFFVISHFRRSLVEGSLGECAWRAVSMPDLLSFSAPLPDSRSGVGRPRTRDGFVYNPETLAVPSVLPGETGAPEPKFKVFALWRTAVSAV